MLIYGHFVLKKVFFFLYKMADLFYNDPIKNMKCTSNRREKKEMKRKQIMAAMLAGAMTITGFGAVNVQADSEDLYEVVMEVVTLGADPAGLQDVENAVNEISEPEIGVHVTLYPVSISDVGSQTSLMITSGEKLDLVSVGAISGSVSSLVSKGALLELDDLYEEYGADIKNAESIAVAGGYFDGSLYAIPSEEKLARSYGFFARTDIVEELGMEFSQDEVYTLEDLEALFAAYKEKYGDGYYCIAGTASNSNFITYMQAIDNLGATVNTGVLMGGGLDDNLTVEDLYESEAFKEYADRMYQWAQAGYYSPDASTNTDANTVQVQSGYYLGCFSSTETDMKANLSRDCGYDMTVINLVAPYAATQMYQTTMWGIPSTCENPFFGSGAFALPASADRIFYGQSVGYGERLQLFPGKMERIGVSVHRFFLGDHRAGVHYDRSGDGDRNGAQHVCHGHVCLCSVRHRSSFWEDIEFYVRVYHAV